ncbi:MAG: hypothetical protein U0414_18515 [Polyangiaceae bacterium]
MSWKNVLRCLAVTPMASALLLLAGCNSAPTASASAAPSTAPSVPVAKGISTASATVEAPAKAPATKVFDLGAVGPKWAGFSVAGPEDAKVMGDDTEARLAAKGPSVLDQKPGGDEGFDIAFEWGKSDLTQHKNLVKKGVDEAKGTMTVLADEPGRLEYSMTGSDGYVRYSFLVHMTVGKTDVTCKNGNMLGAGNEAEHQRLLEACKTLTKK